VAHPVSPRAPRDQPIGVDWLGGHDVRPRDLRSIALFATLTDAQAERFLGTAREEQVATGGHVTDRWAFSRTFFIVLEGRVSVRVDDLEVNVLGPGSYLGEIAAIDWGRDFSYGRSATVVATEATRLLAFPASALREVMAESREIDRELRRVAQARLSAVTDATSGTTSARAAAEPAP
jgi:CRP-like cAMP-binding protein